MRTLASRAYTYCSPQYLEEELNLRTQIFMQNGYPAHIVRKYINKSNPPTSDQATSTNAQPTNHDFFAPFHPAAHRLFRKLKNTFNIQPVFTTTPSLGNFLFKRRPPTNPLTKPGVIYAIPCECNQFYSGETKRTAATCTAKKIPATEPMPISKGLRFLSMNASVREYASWTSMSWKSLSFVSFAMGLV